MRKSDIAVIVGWVLVILGFILSIVSIGLGFVMLCTWIDHASHEACQIILYILAGIGMMEVGDRICRLAGDKCWSSST